MIEAYARTSTDLGTQGADVDLERAQERGKAERAGAWQVGRDGIPRDVELAVYRLFVGISKLD